MCMWGSSEFCSFLPKAYQVDWLLGVNGCSCIAPCDGLVSHLALCPVFLGQTLAPEPPWPMKRLLKMNEWIRDKGSILWSNEYWKRESMALSNSVQDLQAKYIPLGYTCSFALTVSKSCEMDDQPYFGDWWVWGFTNINQSSKRHYL